MLLFFERHTYIRVIILGTLKLVVLDAQCLVLWSETIYANAGCYMKLIKQITQTLSSSYVI